MSKTVRFSHVEDRHFSSDYHSEIILRFVSLQIRKICHVAVIRILPCMLITSEKTRDHALGLDLRDLKIPIV